MDKNAMRLQEQCAYVLHIPCRVITQCGKKKIDGP